jgi:hypothetical protein
LSAFCPGQAEVSTLAPVPACGAAWTLAALLLSPSCGGTAGAAAFVGGGVEATELDNELTVIR